MVSTMCCVHLGSNAKRLMVKCGGDTARSSARAGDFNHSYIGEVCWPTFCKSHAVNTDCVCLLFIGGK